MMRPLVAALAALIALAIAAPVRAASERQGAGMFAAGRALPEVKAEAHVVVRGAFADATITQTFRNDLDRAVEAVYVFPLPADAAVRSMVIRTGDRTITARIEARDRARERYETAVAAGVAAALTEQERDDIFTQQVTGIEPGAEVSVELRFDFGLARWRQGWELALPLVVAPRHVPGTPTGAPTSGTGTAADTDQAGDASRITPPVRSGGGNPITVTIELPGDVDAEAVEVPSHDATVTRKGGVTRAVVRDASSDRDLVVRWRSGDDGGARAWLERRGDGAVIALSIEAPRRAARRDKRRWILALDLSGSMDGDALLELRGVARALLAGIGDEEVAVLGLGDRDVRWQHGKAALRRLGKRIDAAGAGGGTELTELVDGAMSAAADDVAVVLISDGLVADDAAVAARVDGAAARLHVIGVGAAPNRALLGELARRGHGVEIVLGAGDDVDAAATELIAAAAAPAVVPVIDWGGLAVADVSPATLPALAPGRAVVVAARLATVPADATTVTATVGKARLAARLDGATTGTDGLIGRRWARARVEDLVTTGGDAGADEISRLGLAFGLVTPSTALVAVGQRVVVRGGVKTTVTIPVAAPAGMRWQAVFGPSGDVGTTGAEFAADVAAADGEADDDYDRNAKVKTGGDAGTAAEPAAPTVDAGGVGHATSGSFEAESVMVYGRVISARWVRSLSVGGGLHLRGDERAAAVDVEGSAYRAVSQRVALGLSAKLQLAPGLDGGFDAAAYVSSRTLIGPAWTPLLAVELGVGASLDTPGLAWRAALRLGPWRLAPVLRVDQVWTVSGDVAARTSVGGGVEWSF